MRAQALILASAATLGLAGCSKPAATSATTTAATAAAPASAPAPAAPPAATAEAAPQTGSATPAVAVAPPAPPAQPAMVRFSPHDWAAQEHRIAALVANAETRDTLGQTQQVDAQAHAQRMRCTTTACIRASYAAEEAWLRQWEGSSDVR